MIDQAKAAAEELSMKFIGPRNGYPGPPPLPFYPPMCRFSGLLDYDGKQVTYEEYLQSYQERKAGDLVRRRREQDDAEERRHMDTVVNLGESVLAHQRENERHEIEVEEIRERRGKCHEPEGGDVGTVVVKSTKEIVDKLKKDAAAALDAIRRDQDDDEGDLDR